jgi:hypothetical protein
MGILPAMARVDVEIGISGCEVAPLQIVDLWGRASPLCVSDEDEDEVEAAANGNATILDGF